MNTADKTKTSRELLKKAANEADMESSPVLNDDAETKSGATSTQSLPEGNRFKDQ